MQLGDDVFRCEPGGFVYVPIGVRHAFLNLGAQSGECMVLFSPGGTDKFFEEFASVVRAENPPDPMKIAPIFAAGHTQIASEEFVARARRSTRSAPWRS